MPQVSKVDRVWEKAWALPGTRGGRGLSPPRVREAPRRRQHGAPSWTLRSRQDSAQNQEEVPVEATACATARRGARRTRNGGFTDRPSGLGHVTGLQRWTGPEEGGAWAASWGPREPWAVFERGRDPAGCGRPGEREKAEPQEPREEGGTGRGTEPGVWSWSMGLSTRTEQPWPGGRRQSLFEADQADDHQSVRPRATCCPGGHVRDVVDLGL